jgi:enoyl-CoA hydratase/carnithine racemase
MSAQATSPNPPELKTMRFEAEGPVGTLTLARPDAMNAMNPEMIAELALIAPWLADRAPIRALVVTGEGRAFSAGGDVNWFRRGIDEDADLVQEVRRGADVLHQGIVDFKRIPYPVIAAINGPAAGVGLVLACFCDIRFAAAGAKLTTAAPRLGLPAEYGLSWILPRLVGAGHAADLLLSSRVVLAEEAERIGLVNRVLPSDELLPATDAYARIFVEQVSPAAVREAKRQLYTDLHGDVGSAVSESERLLEELVEGPDFAEGVAASKEKRPPRF